MSSKEIAFIKSSNSQIRGTDNDDLKTISDQLDTIETNIDLSIGTSELDIRGTDNDTLETLSAQLDNFSALTDKEKAFLGIGKGQSFQDFFNTVAHDAEPDSTYWTFTTTVNCVADVKNQTAQQPGYVEIRSNTTTGSDGILTTKDKISFSLNKKDATTLYVKSKLKFDFVSTTEDWVGSFGLYGATLTLTDAGDMNRQNFYNTGILCGSANQIFTSISNGDGLEKENISSYVTNGTWFNFESRITTSDVKFYIDDVLRSTLSTYIPNRPQTLGMAVTCLENDSSILRCESVQVWVE